MVNATTHAWERRDKAQESLVRVAQRIKVLEVRETRPANKHSRNIGVVKESGQWLQSGIEGADRVQSCLNRQMGSSCAQVAKLQCGVSDEFPLHAQCPGENFRLDRIYDKRARRSASFRYGLRNNQLRKQSAASQKTGPGGAPCRRGSRQPGTCNGFILFHLELWR